MEASWPGCSLKLEQEILTVKAGAEDALVIPLATLTGFTIVATGSPAPGRAAATTPDAELVLGWREPGNTRRTHVPIPREALQVQLFMMRLSQLRPDADLRERPSGEALRIIGVTQEAAPGRNRAYVAITAAVIVAAIVIAQILLR